VRLFLPFWVPVGTRDWRFGSRDSTYSGTNIPKPKWSWLTWIHLEKVALNWDGEIKGRYCFLVVEIFRDVLQCASTVIRCVCHCDIWWWWWWLRWRWYLYRWKTHHTKRSHEETGGHWCYSQARSLRATEAITVLQQQDIVLCTLLGSNAIVTHDYHSWTINIWELDMLSCANSS